MKERKIIREILKKNFAVISCIWRVGIYYLILLGYYTMSICAIMLFFINDGISFPMLFEKAVLMINENTTVVYVLLSTLSIVSYYILFIREKCELHTKKADKRTIKRKLVLPVLIFGAAAALVVNITYNLIYFKENSEIVELSFGEFALYFVGTVGLVPVIEELLFRKVLVTRLKNCISTRQAIVISSFLFGLMHGGLFDFIYTFFIGIFLCVLYEKTEIITYSMLMHMGFNMTAVLIQMVEFSSNVVCLAITGMGSMVCLFAWNKILLIHKRSKDNEVYCV